MRQPWAKKKIESFFRFGTFHWNDSKKKKKKERDGETDLDEGNPQSMGKWNPKKKFVRKTPSRSPSKRSSFSFQPLTSRGEPKKNKRRRMARYLPSLSFDRTRIRNDTRPNKRKSMEEAKQKIIKNRIYSLRTRTFSALISALTSMTKRTERDDKKERKKRNAGK